MKNPELRIVDTGTSLAVQWLTLRASTAGARVRSLVRGLRTQMPRGAVKKIVDTIWDFAGTKPWGGSPAQTNKEES